MHFLKVFSILKSFSPLHGILSFRLLFGYYFKFSDSLYICLLTKLYCIGSCVFSLIFFCVVVVPASNNTISTMFYHIFMLIDKILNILCSLITEEDFVLKFSSNLSSGLPGFKQTSALSYFMIFAFFTLEVVSFAFSDYGTYRAFDFNASIYEFMSCYNARLTILYITDNYRKAIKYICKPLKDKLQNGNLDDYQKTKDCRDFVDMFIVLRQYLDATTKSMRIKMSICYACEFIKMISMMHYSNEETDMYLSVFVLWYLEITLSVIMISLPSLLMEMSGDYLDDLKKILVSEMVSNKDEAIGDVINDAVDLIDASSLNYTIWNDYPLSMRLILSFFNLLISYLIALLQFLY